MSFWEDRFVNRPHAGAAPSPYTDPSSYNDVQGSAYPHLPSPDEPAWGSAEVSEGSEVSPPADEVVESPVELVEVESPAEVVDESNAYAADEESSFVPDEVEVEAEAE